VRGERSGGAPPLAARQSQRGESASYQAVSKIEEKRRCYAWAKGATRRPTQVIGRLRGRGEPGRSRRPGGGGSGSRRRAGDTRTGRCPGAVFTLPAPVLAKLSTACLNSPELFSLDYLRSGARLHWRRTTSNGGMSGPVASRFRQGRGGARSGRAPECGLRFGDDLPPGTSCQDWNRAEQVFRGEGGARRQAGPATRGRIPAQSADNAKTGLNRNFFGTLAGARRMAAGSPRRQPPGAMRAGSRTEPRVVRRLPPELLFTDARVSSLPACGAHSPERTIETFGMANAPTIQRKPEKCTCHAGNLANRR